MTAQDRAGARQSDGDGREAEDGDGKAVACPKCGTAAQDEARFCSGCGWPFTSWDRPDPWTAREKSAVQAWGSYFKSWGGRDGESAAHRLSNLAIQGWVLVLLAIVFVPIMSSDGNGAVGALVGIGAASFLFVPWLVVLLVLVVIRSTTKGR